MLSWSVMATKPNPESRHLCSTEFTGAAESWECLVCTWRSIRTLGSVVVISGRLSGGACSTKGTRRGAHPLHHWGRHKGLRQRMAVRRRRTGPPVRRHVGSCPRSVVMSSSAESSNRLHRCTSFIPSSYLAVASARVNPPASRRSAISASCLNASSNPQVLQGCRRVNGIRVVNGHIQRLHER